MPGFCSTIYSCKDGVISRSTNCGYVEAARCPEAKCANSGTTAYGSDDGVYDALCGGTTPVTGGAGGAGGEGGFGGEN